MQSFGQKTSATLLIAPSKAVAELYPAGLFSELNNISAAFGVHRGGGTIAADTGYFCRLLYAKSCLGSEFGSPAKCDSHYAGAGVEFDSF
jgi:hypothetical protein